MLLSKHLSDNLKSILDISIKIVNYIKTKPLQSRLFGKLCEEMASKHKALLLFTEVRWLSRGKVLTGLIELHTEITTFLEDKTDLAACLLDDQFIMKLTYLSDIFLKLNELNLYLHASGVDIFSVHDKIRGFIKKIISGRKYSNPQL